MFTFHYASFPKLTQHNASSNDELLLLFSTTVLFYDDRCLQYMSDYSSCLLQGYGVLPSAPTKLKASLISSNYAILEWKHPKVLADTVRTYHLNLRKLGSGDEYTVTEKVCQHSDIFLKISFPHNGTTL